MSKKLRVLITAVGGDVGQSVAKIVRCFETVDYIVGIDMSSEHLGARLVDTFLQAPRAAAPDYMTFLEDLVRKERIDVVIPVSEHELKVLYKEEAVGGARLVMPRGNVFPHCLDKLETANFLKAHGIATPWTVAARESLPVATPCIMKERWTSGSRGLQVIEDDASAQFFAKRRPDAVFQERLQPTEQEYTCGVFRGRNGKTEVIVFHRELAGGHTGKGIVVKDEAIEDVCRRTAEALELQGAINVQLIKSSNGPMPFEINPRFSSTVLFRELLGFRDVLWSLSECLGETADTKFTAPVGTKIYRTFDEVIVHPNEG